MTAYGTVENAAHEDVVRLIDGNRFAVLDGTRISESTAK